MQYAETILDLVGGTPLVRISRLTRDLGPADRQPLLLAKLEMLNPGGSVKDRIGLPMIEAAERAGLLQPGGTIIEPTSGNTGHGLAIAAALKGYRCIFVMADKQSSEKQQLLRAYGAEVVLCPTNVAPESPESYYSVAARLARDIPGAFKPDQYWNQENPDAHEATTGPEIWEQTDGKDHAPRGERRDRWHDHRRGARAEGPQPADRGDRRRPGRQRPVRRHGTPVPDRGRRRGLHARHPRSVGRRSLGPGERSRRLCHGAAPDARGGDPGRWLVRDGAGRGPRRRPGSRPARPRRRRGCRRDPARHRPELPVQGLQRRVDAGQRVAGDDGRGDRGSRSCSPTATTRPSMPPVVVARTTERVGDAIEMLQAYGISQLPVSEDAEGDAVVGLVGSISERGLLERAFRDPTIVVADGGRGHGPAPAAGRGVGHARRGVRLAVGRCPGPGRQSAAIGRPASSPSSTSSSTWPTGRCDPHRRPEPRATARAA